MSYFSCLDGRQYEKLIFQAEDGIRDVERSRGLGDVYKRQINAKMKFQYFVDTYCQICAHILMCYVDT